MFPKPKWSYTTITNPLSSYTATFGKEPGKIQQRHGAFAVNEPFSCIRFLGAYTVNHGEAGALRARKHVALTLRKFSKISLR